MQRCHPEILPLATRPGSEVFLFCLRDGIHFDIYTLHSHLHLVTAGRSYSPATSQENQPNTASRPAHAHSRLDFPPMADDPGPLSGSAKPRPGDGAYLTANGGSHSGSSGSHHAGTIRARGGRRPNRGRRGGGGRGGARDVEGNGQIRQKVDRNPGGAQGQSTHGPNGQDAMGGVDGHTINGTSNHNGHSRQPQRPGRPRDIISAQSPTSTATASTVSGNLDPFAPSFTPLTPIPPGSAPLSRSNSPTRHPAHSRSDGEGGSGQAHPGTRKRNTQRTGLSSRTTPSSPAIPTITSAQSAPKSSRRAAFEQQSKLTDRSDGHGQSGDPEKKSGGGTKGRKKDIGEQKDDLVSRLTRGLKSRPYLECPIVR